jgi:hypothetical protein
MDMVSVSLSERGLFEVRGEALGEVLKRLFIEIGTGSTSKRLASVRFGGGCSIEIGVLRGDGSGMVSQSVAHSEPS